MQIYWNTIYIILSLLSHINYVLLNFSQVGYGRIKMSRSLFNFYSEQILDIFCRSQCAYRRNRITRILSN
jgi:hypothetical protein